MNSARTRLPIPEVDFQRQIIDLAATYKYRIYHTHDSRRSEAGFPDLTMVKGKRLLFVELKAQNGKVRREQHEWLEALAETDAEVYVWRPSDLHEAARILARKPS